MALAFDADNNCQFLSDVPFADHNAMLGPPAPISPAGASKRWPRTDTRPSRRAPRHRSVALSNPTEAGTAAGAWPTFTHLFALRALAHPAKA
jgi:hypothetical protein